MRGANILTGVAVLLWFGLLIIGRDLASGAVGHDYLIVWPSFVLIALLTCAWVCNGMRRWHMLLGVAASAAILATLPFGMLLSGGI